MVEHIYPESGLFFIGLVGDSGDVEFIERLVVGFATPYAVLASVSEGLEIVTRFFEGYGVFATKDNFVLGVAGGENRVATIASKIDRCTAWPPVLHFGEESIPIGE